MVGVLMLVMVTGTGCSREETGVVVALKPDKDPDAMLEEREALEQWLTGALGRRVEVIIPASGAVIEQGLANGTVDLAWVSSTSMAQYVEAGVGDLLLAGEIEGRRYYESYWVALAGAPYASVEDLRGKPVCFASPSSTSGYIIPVHDLARRGLVEAKTGLEAYFGEGHVLYGTGYVSAIQRVFNGQAEAAAVSDYVVLGDKYLEAEEKARLKVVQAQGPVPTHVLAVRSSLAEAQKGGLREAFLGLNETDADLRDRLFGGALREVEAGRHLEPIQKALAFVKSMRGE